MNLKQNINTLEIQRLSYTLCIVQIENKREKDNFGESIKRLIYLRVCAFWLEMLFFSKILIEMVIERNDVPLHPHVYLLFSVFR